MNLEKCQRILIVGICGAGKSTLAKIISDKYNLPVRHLDKLFWNSGWVQTSKELWDIKVSKLIQEETWVMDGNFSSSFPERVQRADLIINLEFNRYVALWRILKRIIKYQGSVRPDLAKGCPERFNWEFMKYVWNFPRDHGRQLYPVINKFGANQKLITLRNQKELSAFIQNLKK